MRTEFLEVLNTLASEFIFPFTNTINQLYHSVTQFNLHVLTSLLSFYFSVVVVGGDGTAHKVLNGLMNRVQAADVNEMKASMTPQRSPTPLAIIPTGM